MRRPHAVLAETHRAAAFASASIGNAPWVRLGEKGWRSKWIEHFGADRPLFIVDDGSRLEDLAWAARNQQGDQLSIGFLRPILGDAKRPRSEVVEPGWTSVRAWRREIDVYLCGKEQVTAARLGRVRRLLHDGAGLGAAWAVGHVGPFGARWFELGGPWTIEPSWLGSLRDTVGGDLDLVFVDDHLESWDPDVANLMLEEARDLGSKLITVERDSGPKAETKPHREPDLAIASHPHSNGRAVLGPGVDLRLVNPIGFEFDSDSQYAAVNTHQPPRHCSVDHWFSEQDLRGLPLRLLDGADLVDRRADGRENDREGLIRVLRKFRAVLDHPLLHRSASARARILSWLACAGVPVVAFDISEELELLLGKATSALLGSTPLERLDDPDSREWYSVQLRRAAMRDMSSSSRLREVRRRLGLEHTGLPAVSVVMATKRPSYLEHAIAQLDRQTYPELEMIVALHGSDFPNGIEEKLRERVRGELEVIRVSDTQNLGQALNVGISRSSGEVVSKWDDDDWYGMDHVWDMVHALEYSGADLVGKAAEFVYLADLDVTIRRFRHGFDAPSHTLAGGTLTLPRVLLDSVGGFPNLPRHVDQGLLQSLATQGAVPFRTHGFGYLLNRHGEHTWSAETDYFLDASFRQWRGVGLEQAGCV